MKAAAAVLVTALVLPAAAPAKGLFRARICSTVSCAETTLDVRTLWPTGTPAQTPPLGPVASLTITLLGTSYRFRYVPSLRLIRADFGNGYSPYWRRAPRPLVTALRPYVRCVSLQP